MRLTAAFACLALAGCSSTDTESTRMARVDPVATCVERGVAYFEKIGSYPALREPPNEGRSAKEVAQERCQRSVASF